MSYATSHPMWFGPSDRPLWGLLHLPTQGCAHAVVLCPPLGYEAWCSYRTFRLIAARLVEGGVGALRLDYDGHGSSAGTYTDPDRVTAWTQSVRLAVAELRRRGIPRVSLLGLRFGATLAAVAETGDAIEHLILWDPIFQGKRYARELKAFAHAHGSNEPDVASDGLFGVSGTVYSAETLAEIARIDLATAPPPTARHVLVLQRSDRLVSNAYRERCAVAGVEVAQHAVAGMAELLETDNEAAQVPEAAVELIVATLTQSPGLPFPSEGVTRDEIALDWDGAPIVEEALRIGPHRLFSIHGRPERDPRSHLVIVLSGGTEHQVGPGRVWVEFTRAMNARGFATLRADLDGIGESPIRGPRPIARSYDPEHVLDLEDLVAFGRARGYAKVVVVGLCSGAWLAVQGALVYGVDAVFALNAQLYWEYGHTVYGTVAATKVGQRPARDSEVEGQRSGRWSFLDGHGVRTPAMRWLDGLLQRQVRVHLAYAENDEGLRSLTVRNEQSLARLLQNPLLTLEEMLGIDHGMHRFRRRQFVLERILAFLASI